MASFHVLPCHPPPDPSYTTRDHVFECQSHAAIHHNYSASAIKHLDSSLGTNIVGYMTHVMSLFREPCPATKPHHFTQNTNSAAIPLVQT